MNNTLTIDAKAVQSVQFKVALILLSVGLVFMAKPLTVLGQAIGDNAIKTNAQVNAVAKTNEAPRALLSQRLGGPVANALAENNFQPWMNGIVRRERISVGDLKKLLKYDDKELKLLPSCAAGYSAYELPFVDVRCIVEVVEEHKSVYDNATLVTVGVNTNPSPVSPTRYVPKRGQANR